MLEIAPHEYMRANLQRLSFLLSFLAGPGSPPARPSAGAREITDYENHQTKIEAHGAGDALPQAGGRMA